MCFLFIGNIQQFNAKNALDTIHALPLVSTAVTRHNLGIVPEAATTLAWKVVPAHVMSPIKMANATPNAHVTYVRR